MLNAKDITTEKGFEIAEFVVSLFSGALFIFFVDRELFVSLDIWRLILLSVAIVLPLFVIVKLLMHVEILFTDRDRWRDEIRTSLTDECDEKKQDKIVEKKMNKHMHRRSIQMASTGVTFVVVIVAFWGHFVHWKLEILIMIVYGLTIVLSGKTAFREYRKEMKREKDQKKRKNDFFNDE